jgi:hypothetical protein
MALNATLHSQMASNQPATTFLSATCVVSGSNGTNGFIVTEPTAIQRLDILAETKTGTLTTSLAAFTLLSTLQDGFAPVTSGGAGYNNGTFTGVTVTNGSIATAQATVVVSGGAIQSVNITDGGTQYALSSTGSLPCTFSGGSGGGIGTAGTAAVVNVPLTTGTGTSTGTISGSMWVASNAAKAARLLPSTIANLGSGFPTAAEGFRVSLQESSGKACLATAYAVGSPATANMTISKVTTGVYRFAFNSTRVSGSLPPIVVKQASLSLNQGPGVSNGSLASTVFAGIGLDGKIAGTVTFGVTASVLNVNTTNGDIDVLITDHNNLPADPYPGSSIAFELLLRNSSAVV